MKFYIKVFYITILIEIYITSIIVGCQFYPTGDYLRFVRVPENLPVGDEVLKIQVYPRKNLTIEPVDKTDDVSYFSFRDINRTTVAVHLRRTLEDLVDRDNPQNVLKFRLVCDNKDGDDMTSSYLSVTVYVEDVNDHSPMFIDAPYRITVDELTPVGLTIFRGIQAFDRDKPNTPNSDVQYHIASGNTRGRFGLESSHRAHLIVRKPLDYDNGDREFRLIITATDRGSPPRSANTTVTINVLDNDDLNPKFTQDVYKTQITEFYPITKKHIHQELKFKPRIFAYDQDIALDAPIRYDIIAGNDRHLFVLDQNNGTLFLEREIDLDSEMPPLPKNTFVLQLQASQVDNPLKTALARAEIEILDINDNLPEFEVDFYNISIVENLPNGFSVLQVIANDRDQGINAEFSYVLEDKKGAFNLDSRTGWLTVRDQSVLDREKQPALHMKVYAKEKVKNVITNNDMSAFVKIDVTLLDANDNNPTFIPSNLYEFTVSNDVHLGHVVGTVKATDPDLGRNGLVLYNLQRSTNKTGSTPFVVDAQSGRITVLDTPIMEGRHVLFIEASDQPVNPSERRYSLAVVTIDVQRANSAEDLPDFIGAPYEFWVGGNVGIGTSVGQIRINEAARQKDVVYDLLHSYHDGVPFAVEERTGTITVISNLEKFHRRLYDFEAVITNEKDVTLVTNVTIHVVDNADERGILMKGTNGSPIEFRVRENMSGALIGKLFYQNITRNITSKSLRFLIANQPDVTDYIAISQDGTLYTRKGLDREERDTYRLTVIAEYSKGFLSGAGIYQVTVYVDDENDNAPIFTQPSYEGSIKENSPPYTEVKMSHLINATDKDKGINSQFTLTLFGDRQDIFQVNQTTGKVIYKGTDALDREVKSVYNFRLIARDKGSLSSEVRLTITIEDVNDNAPTFLQMVILADQGVKLLEYDEHIANLTGRNSTTDVLTMHSKNSDHLKPKHAYVAPLISLPESIPVGTAMVRLLAHDKDAGENAILTYSIVSESAKPSPNYIPGKSKQEPHIQGGPRYLSPYFMIAPVTGEVIVARTLPAESEFRLNISAMDRGGLSDNVTIRFYVYDVNDHAPVFQQMWYSFDAVEGHYSKVVLGKIEAVDSDYGQNANVSYLISEKYNKLPFIIAANTGILSVDGELDREYKDKYKFTVVAQDNAPRKLRKRSTVDVEVNVLDLNDNAPVFYGYDKLITNPVIGNSSTGNSKRDNITITPVYMAKVAENVPVGTAVTRVFANDSDFPGNGNGLFLFDIPHRTIHGNLFAIDSKDGIVTTLGKLDYETQNKYNITIVATDLGFPSLSSSALLIIDILDIPEADEQEIRNVIPDGPAFTNRYYELEVEENIQVPLKILNLNMSDEFKNMSVQYSIVNNDSYILEMFKIDPMNGILILIQSPDRELRAKYEIIVRVDNVKMARGIMKMVYPVSSENLSDLESNEAKVVVRIRDVNDNYPKFINSGRPIVAAIPTSANFGYQIVRLQATDLDEGLNGEIRYQILGRSDDHTRRFAIDSLTGQVRAVASFAQEAGRVFGFDVKATDRRGADDGKSSIANVFVYVLDEEKQLIMVLGSQPMDVEKAMDNITSILYNVTGYDVRIRKLEPHWERNLIDSSATDMYIYAVDPQLNIIVETKQLEKVLQKRQADLEKLLQPYQILEIGTGMRIINRKKMQRFILSTVEITIIVIGCFIFIIALVTALCVACTRKRQLRHTSGHILRNSNHLPRSVSTTRMGYALGSTVEPPAGALVKPPSTNSLYPLSYGEVLSEYTAPTAADPTYILDSHHSPSKHSHRHLHQSRYQTLNLNNNSNARLFNDSKYRGQFGGIVRVPARCSSFSLADRILRSSTHHNHAMETSIASIHSSGKDSGIVDGGQEQHSHVHICQCGQSTTQSSEESSNSYEDSLKSVEHRDLQHQHHLHQHHHRTFSNRRFSVPLGEHPFERNHHSSFRDEVMRSSPMLHRLPSIHPGHSHRQINYTVQQNPLSIPRRHSERLLAATGSVPS